MSVSSGLCRAPANLFSCHSNLCQFVRKITADIIFIKVCYVNNVCYKSIQADDLTWICVRHEKRCVDALHNPLLL